MTELSPGDGLEQALLCRPGFLETAAVQPYVVTLGGQGLCRFKTDPVGASGNKNVLHIMSLKALPRHLQKFHAL